MNDTQTILVPAVNAGFEIIQFGFADAEAPILMLRREPVVAWQLTAHNTLRPMAASPKPFDLDNDVNTVLVHPNGATVCRGEQFAQLTDYIESRQAALRRQAVARARQELQAAALALSKRVGRDTVIALLEKYRPAGLAAPIVKVWDVSESRLAELRADIAKHELRVGGAS
jgi:hypothetical protein